MIYDVVIIGAGVSGAACARELSRYKLNVIVLEKEEDVCCGTSKANSAIVHAGFDAHNGSLMAKLNVRGSEMMEEFCKELDIPYRRNGAFVVCTDESMRDGLNELLRRGEKNGVKGLRIVSGDEARAMEPNLSDHVVAALYAPTSAVICPFILNIAMAENAYTNGVEFAFNTEVRGFEKEDGLWVVKTGKGDYRTRCVVNAAGVYSGIFHNMVSEEKINIKPRRGEYCLLDKSAGSHVNSTIFPQPTKFGKGILVSPTIHGNLLVGPNANDIEDHEGTNTTGAGLAEVLSKAAKNVKNIPTRDVITSFAGLRAREESDEFIIGEVKDAPGFVDCAGIESPGLSSSPAIGETVGDIVAGILNPEMKENWNGTRKGILNPSELSLEERNELIRREPAYGRIICRCESVTEGEILDAIRRPLGARSLDGVKRRTRAGMGRCQAGFCTPRTMELLNRELGLKYEDITKRGGESRLVLGRTKGEETC